MAPNVAASQEAKDRRHYGL